MRTIKLILTMLAAVLLLPACAAPNADNTAPTDDNAAALQAEVETLTGKVAQLQEKVENLQQENELLQNDATSSSAEDLSYLLDEISQSGQTLAAFPALVTAASASGDGFTITIDRLEYNPDYQPGASGDQTYLLNSAAEPEDVYADLFTYVHYDGYLMPELDESFAGYLGSDGVQFIVYLLGNQVIYLDEILVP